MLGDFEIIYEDYDGDYVYSLSEFLLNDTIMNSSEYKFNNGIYVEINIVLIEKKAYTRLFRF